MSRGAFSLLEMAVTVALLAIMAIGVVVVLEDEPERALEIRTREELKRYRDMLQRKALRTPSMPLGDLRSALDLREEPRDPWGQPYVLDGERIGPGDQAILEMRVLSYGPDRFPDGETRAPEDVADDLWVKVKLPNPAFGPTGGEGSGAMPTPPPGLRVDISDASVRLCDWEDVDGDRVEVSLNGNVVAGSVILGPCPGYTLPLALNPGANVLEVVALTEGGSRPCTVELEPGSGGPLSFRLALRATESVVLRLYTP